MIFYPTPKGQKIMNDSIPVVLSSNHSNIPTTIAGSTFVFSTLETGNSTAVNLGAGATFAGTIEDLRNQPSISILARATQNLLITVTEFQDSLGNNVVGVTTFVVNANTPFKRSFPINGNFVRVSTQNTGASATTSLNVDVAYGNIQSANQLNNLPVSISDVGGVNITNGLLSVSEPSLSITGASAQTAVVNNILDVTSGANAINVSGYRSITCQVISTGTGGTFIFEQSNTGGASANEWKPLPVYNNELITGVPITGAITATASQTIYSIPARCNFIRLRIATTITGGSIQAFTKYSTETWTPSINTVAQPTGANLNVTATISGTPNVNIGTGAIAAGTNAIGDVGTQYRANATGSSSFAIVNCPATPALQTIKASAGRVLGIYLTNANASLRFLKIFNATAVTLGTTAAVLDIPIPPNNNPVYINLEGGLGFLTAITCVVTSGKGTTNNGAVTLDEVGGFIAFA